MTNHSAILYAGTANLGRSVRYIFQFIERQCFLFTATGHLRILGGSSHGLFYLLFYLLINDGGLVGVLPSPTATNLGLTWKIIP